MILRCLRKDPQRRYQHIADVKVALQDIKEDSESATGAAVYPRKRRGRLTAASGRKRLVAVVAGGCGRSRTPRPAPRYAAHRPPRRRG